MSVREGDRAPGFTLPAGPEEEIDVGELFGRERVVLAFFPLAFSPVCTDELCAFARRWDRLDELDARVFGISVDSPFVNARFREEEDLPFPLLSDFNREVADEWGVLHDDLMGLEGVARRSVFVVGADGRVAYRWVTDDPDVEPDYEEVRAAVRAAPAAA